MSDEGRAAAAKLTQDEQRLSATDAQRLSRLRVLAIDARRRADDPTELGQHLAILAIDGVGELAVGLCLHRVGRAPRPTNGLAKMLDALVEALQASPLPGGQGFKELHRVRNLAQHEGVLPAPSQIPRWLAETELMVDFLVERVFGIRLAEALSANGILDDDLRDSLQEAERHLEKGDPRGSIELSWGVLEQARSRLSREIGPQHSGSPRSVGDHHLDQRFRSISRALSDVVDQFELAAFTAEPAEWLWFRHRYREVSRGGPEPTEAEARRALVFVLGWTLRLESYIARQSTERWEEWEERQRAPVTGVPGGPHLRDFKDFSTEVDHSRVGGPGEIYKWTFQLTDVPEIDEPDFTWAMREAAHQIGETHVRHSYLNKSGEFVVSTDSAFPASEVKAFALRAIELAHAVLEQRARDDETERAEAVALTEPFKSALGAAGIAEARVEPVIGSPISPNQVSPLIRIAVRRTAPGNQSAFARGLEESFEAFFPDRDRHNEAGAFHFDALMVSSDFPPDDVARWVLSALVFDEEDARKRAEIAAGAASRRATARKEMEALMGSPDAHQ